MSGNNQTDQFNTPILFIVFNRPDLTKKVFAKIKEIRPKQLFIAADGPRSGNVNDAVKCQEVRDYLLSNIDWQCSLQTLFRSDNLGCGLSCAGAVDWFFEQIEEGIIIEDDCLPDSSFFVFCSEMLDRYRHQEQIMHITGVYSGEPYLNQYSYYFSRIAHVGAWASWRQAWQRYNFLMKSWPKFKLERQLSNIFYSKVQQKWWDSTFSFMYEEESKNTWDFQWDYAIFSNFGFTIQPMNNLIDNIGFIKGASHAYDNSSLLIKHRAGCIDFPLKHPTFILVNNEADYWKNRYLLKATWFNFGIKKLLRKIGLFTLVKRAYYLLRKK